MPPQSKRQVNQSSPSPVHAKPEPFKFFDSTEVLKGTSMYQRKDEIFPTLPFDFSKLELNQQFISMNTDELYEFIETNGLKEGSKVWISNNKTMILTSLMTRESIPTLTIHWCVRQYVVVRGDASDFDGGIE